MADDTIYGRHLKSFLGDIESRSTVGSPGGGGLSPGLERAVQRGSWYDIETYGLSPKSSIYEMGVAHGRKDPTFTHVKPGGDPMSAFTRTTIAEREKGGLPGLDWLTQKSQVTQKQAARESLAGFSGRDVIVQNLRFESQFLGERIGKGEFQSWARQSKLQSYTPGQSRIYATDVQIGALETRARSASTLDESLKHWGEVFTGAEGKRGYKQAILEGKGAVRGGTRFFEQMSITASVFALAQQSGAMPKTGELIAGSSVEAFAQAAYGMKEVHGAAYDVGMQRHMFQTYMDIGERLSASRELTAGQAGLLRKIGSQQQAIKQTRAEARIRSAYLGIKEMQGGLPEKALEGELVRPLKLGEFEQKLKVLDESTGKYQTETVQRKFRDRNVRPLETMDEIVETLQARADRQTSTLSPDYKKAYETVRRDLITPFETEQKRLVGTGMHQKDAIRLAYESDAVVAGRERLTDTAKQRLEQTYATSDSLMSRAKKNWGKLAIAGAGALFVANKIYGGDDAYNVIEGLPERGYAGSSRRTNTEFGSGYQGPNKWLHPSYNEAEEQPKFQLMRASKLGASYGELISYFTKKDEVPAWVEATAMAGTALHRLEAAKKYKAGEIETAEEFLYDPTRQISGHIDLTLKGNIPGDIKTVSERRMRQVERQGAFRKHVSQLNFYMHAKGAEKGFLEYVSREDPSKRKVTWHAYDPELFERDVGRMQAARAAVQRGIVTGKYDKDKLPKGASLQTLQKAAVEEQGEVQRDVKQIGRLGRVFEEQMEYLRYMEAKRDAKKPRHRNSSRFSGRDDAYNTIEAFRHEGIAGATRQMFNFGSGWTGLLEAAKSFVQKYPKTTGVMGAGAAASLVFGGSKDVGREEESSLVGSVLGFAGKAALGMAALVALPGVAMAGQAALVARSAGGSALEAFKKTLPHSLEAGYKGQWAMIKGYFKAHTGDSGQALLKEAEAKGVDISLGAQLKRAVTGPAEVMKGAAEHTAQWLEKNWAPVAEKMNDPAAMGLALLSGYEAVNIGRDALDMDAWGVAKGVALFAGAKYAYMGWHNRAAIKAAWQKSNVFDKTVGGYGALGILGQADDIIREAIHSTFGYARYGMKPKELYKEVGANIAGSGPEFAEVYLKAGVDTVAGVDPKVAQAIAKSFEGIGRDATDLGQKLMNLDKAGLKGEVTNAAESVGKAETMFKDALKGRFKNVDWDKESLLVGGAERKAAGADYDQMFGSYSNLTEKIREKGGASSEKMAKIKEHLAKLKEKAKKGSGTEFSGHGDAHNTVEGFQEAGVNAQKRKDFGSGHVIDRSTIPVAKRSLKDRSRPIRMAQGHRIAMNQMVINMDRKNINRSYRG